MNQVISKPVNGAVLAALINKLQFPLNKWNDYNISLNNALLR